MSDIVTPQKKRRVSAASRDKACTTIANVSKQLATEQFEKDLADVVTLLRKSPQLVLPVKAYIMTGGNAEAGGGEEFTRQVRTALATAV